MPSSWRLLFWLALFAFVALRSGGRGLLIVVLIAASYFGLRYLVRGFQKPEGASDPEAPPEPEAPPPRRSAKMSRAEALRVLGLSEGASPERITEAHRNLIKKLHPDQGGTSYLAQQVNEAKQVLLGR